MNSFTKAIIIFLLISCSAFSQQKIIVWGEIPLDWKHFQAKLRKSSKFDANSRLRINSKYSINNDSLHVIIFAEFCMAKSRVKGNPSKYLLKHEQLHFDITEYYTRLLRKELASYKFEARNQIRSRIRYLVKKYYNLSKKTQSKYDFETNHSIKEFRQESWNEKIGFWLKQTNQYASPKMSLDLSYLK